MHIFYYSLVPTVPGLMREHGLIRGILRVDLLTVRLYCLNIPRRANLLALAHAMPRKIIIVSVLRVLVFRE